MKLYSLLRKNNKLYCWQNERKKKSTKDFIYFIFVYLFSSGSFKPCFWTWRGSEKPCQIINTIEQCSRKAFRCLLCPRNSKVCILTIQDPLELVTLSKAIHMVLQAHLKSGNTVCFWFERAALCAALCKAYIKSHLFGFRQCSRKAFHCLLCPRNLKVCTYCVDVMNAKYFITLK